MSRKRTDGDEGVPNAMMKERRSKQEMAKNQMLTVQEIELLSAWHDGELGETEAASAVALVASSSAAREWAEQAAIVGGLTRDASLDALDRSAPGRPPRTHELLEADQKHPRRLVVPLLLTSLLLLTTAGVLLFDPFGSGTDVANQELAVDQSADDLMTSSEKSGTIPVEWVERLVRFDPSIIPSTKPGDAAVPASSGARTPVSARRELVSTASLEVTPAKTPDTTPDATITPESIPSPATTAAHNIFGVANLTIELRHSNADIIIGNDEGSDTIRVDGGEDRALAFGIRLSELTDSLNAEVWRIATDTTRSPVGRTEEILRRHREYDQLVNEEIRRLSGDTSKIVPPRPEGAWLDRRDRDAVAGLS